MLIFAVFRVLVQLCGRLVDLFPRDFSKGLFVSHLDEAFDRMNNPVGAQELQLQFLGLQMSIKDFMVKFINK